MKISILCSSLGHPIYPHLQQWVLKARAVHEVELVQHSADVRDGDLLFLIACAEIVPRTIRSKFRQCLVVHASDLPQGRGWSPHIWQILEGASSIPVTLLEAEDKVDTGRIWAMRRFELAGHELYDEINEKLFAATLELMDFAVQSCATIQPHAQSDGPATYYRKRTPEDSRLDPDKTLAQQFDLLRVADPRRFPCFLEHRGTRYLVILTKDTTR